MRCGTIDVTQRKEIPAQIIENAILPNEIATGYSTAIPCSDSLALLKSQVQWKDIKYIIA